MKFSFNLLKQFIPIKKSPKQPVELINQHSFKVEETIKNRHHFAGIITAKVLQIEKHPNADRLRVVKLDAGKRTVEPVVCGAFNFEVGDMVALALPGANITQNIHSETHESFVLQKTKIRGVLSQGMICAAFELGLSNKPGKGIMVLKNDIKPGSQFMKEMIG